MTQNMNKITEIALRVRNTYTYRLEQRLLSEILIELKVANLYHLTDKTDMDGSTFIKGLEKLGKFKEGRYQI